MKLPEHISKVLGIVVGLHEQGEPATLLRVTAMAADVHIPAARVRAALGVLEKELLVLPEVVFTSKGDERQYLPI